MILKALVFVLAFVFMAGMVTADILFLGETILLFDMDVPITYLWFSVSGIPLLIVTLIYDARRDKKDEQ
ncbi:MAG: hypothetical protein K6L73_13155 [Cellvibrionaceae bacterium]